MNLGAVSFLLITKIFSDQAMNYISIYNEMTILAISYFIMQVNDVKHEPEQSDLIGEIIVHLINVQWGINGLVMSLYTVRATYFKLMSLLKNRCFNPKKQSPEAGAEAERMPGRKIAAGPSESSPVVQERKNKRKCKY